MNYKSTVMTLAHRLYRSQPANAKPTWSNALTEAHAIVKDRMKRDQSLAIVLKFRKRAYRTAPTMRVAA